MSWASIILALLRIVEVLMTTAQQNKWIKAGQDQEIARQTAKILSMSEAAKKEMERINGLNEKEVDDLLRGLEPSSGV